MTETRHRPTLHLLCGKIASGKSTLASELLKQQPAVLIAEDEWLSALFADQLKTGADYVHCSGKLRTIMEIHVAALLDAGVSVVLDFPGNTVEQRRWMLRLLDGRDADHRLHYLEASDALCLARLRDRNASGEHAFAPTEAMFHRFTKNFVPPSNEEGFHVVVHRQSV